MKSLLGREVCIDGKDGEITNILGCGYEITFFDLRFGKTYMDARHIKDFLKADV